MIRRSMDTNLYTTADLGIATYLLTIGHELKDATLLTQKRLLFHFTRLKDTDALVEKFLNETGTAPAKRLFENYRALRALAFSKTGNLR